MNHIRVKILLKRVNSLLFCLDICYNFNMNNRDNKIKLVVIVIIVFFILGTIGFILTFNSRNSDTNTNTPNNKESKNSINYVICPVSKYTIVSGTIITSEMLGTEKFESVDDYNCSMSLVVGKCVKNNTMIEKGSRIKDSDLVDCEV